MSFIASIVVLSFLILVFLCAVVLFFWSMHDALRGGDDPVTSAEAIAVIAEEIRLRGLESGMLYDLGSCRGTFALALQKELPNLQITGIDDSFFRILLSRVRSIGLDNKPVFLHGDLFSLPLSDADMINVYLPREMLPRVYRHIELSKKSLLVTMYRISFTNTPPIKTISLAKEGEHVRIYNF